MQNSTYLYESLAYQFRILNNSWAIGFNILLNKPPADALRPIIPDNARTLCITAAAGTELAGAYS